MADDIFAFENGESLAVPEGQALHIRVNLLIDKGIITEEEWRYALKKGDYGSIVIGKKSWI